MAKIKYKLEIGYAGCHDEGETDVGDMSNKEIDDMVYEMAQEWGSTWEGDERLSEDWDTDEGVEEFYQNCEGSWEFIEDE